MARPLLVDPFSPTKSTTTSAPSPSVRSRTEVDLVLVAQHTDVGPDRRRELQRGGVPVDDDVPRWGERLEHLDPDVPEAAGADDDAGVPRREPASRPRGMS